MNGTSEQSSSLILASASPRRRELLAKGFPDFQVVVSDVEETACPLENALRKAEAVAVRFPDSVVVGADTVIRLDGAILGKPADLNDARRMLGMFSGRVHEVATGVCVRCVRDARTVRFEETTRVRFRELSREMIERYLACVSVSDKAGAYAIQEHGDWIVERIEGSLDNVIGLPTERLFETLRLVFHSPGSDPGRI